jgi:outer membrane protein assembly factor BamB
MKAMTVTVAFGIVVILGTVVGFGLTGGMSNGSELTATWTSDTGRQVSANHHAVAVADGSVYAPISDDGDGSCALISMGVADGEIRWTYGIPPENCTIHAVADPTVTDVDSDGQNEVLAATTEKEVAILDTNSGDSETGLDLSDYGYTQPIVANLAPTTGQEIIAVDVTGTVFVFGSDDTTLWTANLNKYVWAQPTVEDLDGDSRSELLIGGQNGNAVLFGHNGTVEWNATVSDKGSITWGTHGQADEDPALESFFATTDGDIVAVDGRNGVVEWRTTVGELAAVRAFGDADNDGSSEVYATAQNGRVHALDAATGEKEWTTEVVVDRVQMMPPPNLGDLNGDGSLELLAVGNDGSVTVLNPETGAILSSYARDVQIFTHATIADSDDDGAGEAYVIYADGRVVRLEYKRLN